MIDISRTAVNITREYRYIIRNTHTLYVIYYHESKIQYSKAIWISANISQIYKKILMYFSMNLKLKC